MNLAAILEFVTIVTYIVVLASGKQKRQTGWKLLSIILLVTGMVQCAAMAIVVSLTLSDAISYELLLTEDRRTLMTMITGFSLAGG
jgi:formate hydrogenlyase subunit 3/multisubunit Na+/H+ antiporter MnhD subunit